MMALVFNRHLIISHEEKNEQTDLNTVNKRDPGSTYSGRKGGNSAELVFISQRTLEIHPTDSSSYNYGKCLGTNWRGCLRFRGCGGEEKLCRHGLEVGKLKLRKLLSLQNKRCHP